MIAWLIANVGSRILSLVGIASAVLGSILLVFQAGKNDERKDQELDELKDFKETKEKVDEVPTDLDRDSAVERLRKSGHIRED
jgi:hypothetical protein